MRRIAIALGLLLVLLFPALLSADSLELDDGRVIEGKIIDETSKEYTVDMNGLEIKLEKDRVVKVTRSGEGGEAAGGEADLSGLDKLGLEEAAREAAEAYLRFLDALRTKDEKTIYAMLSFKVPELGFQYYLTSANRKAAVEQFLATTDFSQCTSVNDMINVDELKSVPSAEVTLLQEPRFAEMFSAGKHDYVVSCTSQVDGLPALIHLIIRKGKIAATYEVFPEPGDAPVDNGDSGRKPISGGASEGSVKGHVNDWISSDGKNMEAKDALVEIGVDALPPLLKMIRREKGKRRFMVRWLAAEVLYGGEMPFRTRDVMERARIYQMSTKFTRGVERIYDFLNDETNLPCVFDPMLGYPATYLGRGVRWIKKTTTGADVIEAVCDQGKVEWIPVYGVIFFSSPKRIDDFYSDAISEWKKTGVRPRCGMFYDDRELPDDPQWRKDLVVSLQSGEKTFHMPKPMKLKDFIMKEIEKKTDLPIEFGRGWDRGLPDEADDFWIGTKPDKFKKKVRDLRAPAGEMLALALGSFGLGIIFEDEKIVIVNRAEADKAWVERRN